MGTSGVRIPRFWKNAVFFSKTNDSLPFDIQQAGEIAIADLQVEVAEVERQQEGDGEGVAEAGFRNGAPV